jgi:HAD superfamily hydrolase (TIGR01509 family)
MVKAVIFDMDNLMIDSRDLWKRATKELLSQFGKTHDPEFAKQFSGLKSHDVATLIRDHYQLTVTANYISETRNQIMLKLAQKPVKTMPGLQKLLTLLRKTGHKKAIATSSYKVLAHQLLKSANVFDHFETIITGEDVIHGKPAPDIFLHAAKHLNVNAEHCLVLEDAPVGIKAAHAAGMKSIAISKHESSDLFPNSNYFFTSLTSINLSVLNSL